MAIFKVKARKPKGLFLGLSLLSPPTLSWVEASVFWFTFCHPWSHSKTFPQPTKQLQESSLAQWWRHRGPRREKRKYHRSLAILQTFPKWLMSRAASADYTGYTVARNTWGRVWPCVPNCVSSTGLCPPKKRAFSLPKGKEWCHQTLFPQYKIWPERASFSNLMKCDMRGQGSFPRATDCTSQ